MKYQYDFRVNARKIVPRDEQVTCGTMNTRHEGTGPFSLPLYFMLRHLYNNHWIIRGHNFIPLQLLFMSSLNSLSNYYMHDKAIRIKVQEHPFMLDGCKRIYPDKTRGIERTILRSWVVDEGPSSPHQKQQQMDLKLWGKAEKRTIHSCEGGVCWNKILFYPTNCLIKYLPTVIPIRSFMEFLCPLLITFGYFTPPLDRSLGSASIAIR